MNKKELLNTSFICPYMKIQLEAICTLETCPYNVSTIETNCLWKYASEKGSISPTELAIILNINKENLYSIFQNAKLKIIKMKIKQKLATTIFKIKYCSLCGKAFDLKMVNNKYICRKECMVSTKIIDKIQEEFKKPISYILSLLPTLIKFSIITRLLKVSNKSVKDMYKAVFGDSSLIIRLKDIKDPFFKKRTRRLNINLLGRKAKLLSFPSIEKQILNFKEDLK